MDRNVQDGVRYLLSEAGMYDQPSEVLENLRTLAGAVLFSRERDLRQAKLDSEASVLSGYLRMDVVSLQSLGYCPWDYPYLVWCVRLYRGTLTHILGGFEDYLDKAYTLCSMEVDDRKEHTWTARKFLPTAYFGPRIQGWGNSLDVCKKCQRNRRKVEFGPLQPVYVEPPKEEDDDGDP